MISVNLDHDLYQDPILDFQTAGFIFLKKIKIRLTLPLRHSLSLFKSLNNSHDPLFSETVV